MKDKKALIIFDFDNTLFKTREFWREYLFPFYGKIGISRQVLEKALVGATTGAFDYFIPRIFINELHYRVKKSREISKKQLADIFERNVYSTKVKKYFYPHALKLLARAKRKYQMLLISYGDKAFKTKFFGYCGINKYFSPQEIIITNKPKLKFIKKIAIPKKCIIIDDLGSEIRDLSSYFKKRGATVTGLFINHKDSAVKENNKQTIICKTLMEAARRM